MTGPDTPDDASVPPHLLESVGLLSKKWHPAIVRILATDGGIGFSDLERRLEGISAKVLTDALDELTEYEVLARTETSQQPLRVEYALTDRGHDLADVIDSLADWGEQHLAGDDEAAVVLVAEDDRRIATMHTTWLEEEYTVRVAHDGEEALRELDTDVDVVVLDRRMPGLSGDEVLDWIRWQRFDCRVVMVTSEDPTPAVATLGFDEYVSKPLLKDDLQAVVADLVERASYDREVRRYLALRSKLAVLEAENTASSLAASEEYTRLREQFEELQERVDESEVGNPEQVKRLGIGGEK